MKLDITIYCGEDTDYRLSREDASICAKRGRDTYDIVVHSTQSPAHVAVLVSHEVRGIINKEYVK